MGTPSVPSHIVYMKSGVFASETLDSILRRKQAEVRACGRFFWGYGGTLCHPTTQIQPFARAVARAGQRLYLVMSVTPSQLHQPPHPAAHFSTDNKTAWTPLPPRVAVYGSRFALVCGEPRECRMTMDFREFEVAVGPSAGCPLDRYIGNRIDKACARRTQPSCVLAAPGAASTPTSSGWRRLWSRTPSSCGSSRERIASVHTEQK